MGDWLPVYAILAFLFVFVALNLIESRRID